MPVPSDSYGAAVYNTVGLVGYWRLDESGGTVAADTVGAAPGVYMGAPTLGASGIAGGAGNTACVMSPTGGKYVRVPSVASIRLGNGPLTVEAWVKRSTVNGANNGLMSGGSNAYYLRINNASQIQFLRSQIAIVATSTVTLTDVTNWHHVVATKSGSTTRLYLDGVELAATVTDATLIDTPFPDAYIGADLNAAEVCDGTIDEVAVYNVALSAATIGAHYTLGMTPPPPPPSPVTGTGRLTALLVECAFTTHPLATNPAWVDITPKVREIGIRRGRDNELDRYQAGIATIIVDNRDRRFDPMWPTGPYYPNVLPGKRIRVRAGSNLLTNSNFETDLAGWTVMAGSGTSRLAGDAAIGTACLRMQSAGSTLGRSQAVPALANGAVVTVSFYARLEGGSTGTLNYDITGGGGFDAPGIQLPVAGLSTSWTRYSTTFVYGGTTGTATARVFVDGPPATGVDVRVDGLMVETGTVMRVWNDGVMALFDGYVEAWPQTWNPPREATVPITAVDAFKLLSIRTFPGAYAALIRSHNPVGYWRLGDASPPAVDASDIENHGTYVGGVSLNQLGGLAGDGDRAALFDGSSGYVNVPNHVAYSTTQFTAECWFNLSVWPASTNPAFINRRTSGNVGGFTFETGTSGVIALHIYTTTWTGIPYAIPGWSTGAWYHVAATYNGATVALYVNGVQVTTQAVAGPLNTPASPLVYIGRNIAAAAGGFQGLLDEVALYGTALSADQIAAHYRAGRQIYPVQGSAARVSAVLDAIGWPATGRVINGGTETMQSSTVENVSVLQHLEAVGETEAGRMFIDAAGRVRFDGRDTYFIAPFTNTKGTFGDNPADATERRYVQLTASYDDSQLWNDIRLSRDGGVVQIAVDTTSQETYGVRSYTKSGLLHATDNAVLAVAQYLRNQYKNPKLRFVQLSVRPGDRADLWEQVLGREVGDRIRVGRRPQGIPPAIAQDCWIEGIQHDISPQFWETRWSLSRADSQTFWQLGNATYGILGSTTWLSF